MLEKREESVSIKQSRSSIRWGRVIPAGLVGGIASLLLTGALYASTKSILFNPATQGAKVLSVYNSIQPLPLSTTNMALFAVGWVILALVRTSIFSTVYNSLPGKRLGKGLSWGLVMWLTVIMFAEFYTAINLLGEPLYLAAIEVSFLMIPFLAEGFVVGMVYGRARPT